MNGKFHIPDWPSGWLGLQPIGNWAEPPSGIRLEDFWVSDPRPNIAGAASSLVVRNQWRSVVSPGQPEDVDLNFVHRLFSKAGSEAIYVLGQEDGGTWCRKYPIGSLETLNFLRELSPYKVVVVDEGCSAVLWLPHSELWVFFGKSDAAIELMSCHQGAI